ncbi:undecaprenyl-diphosphate phosphatase [Vicingaceae bacterium]|nr:undecaprenyl-diphosphate phosphatase [Vicingaceae bacterium]MDB4061052.1 undecaprenyl-diphosphate phosphatase [Vicingaceae bacterium]MDC1451856.1 undecaprenyl-diphosphate phosphatase [Vicingaceae bacterium]
MDIIDAIILGVIQGLTEFLPVSSSGHLEIAKTILGDESLPKDSLLFTVTLHFATALSTIVIFRKDISEILKGLLKFNWNEESQFSIKIIVSMLPATFIGLFYEEELEKLFGGNILFVGAMLLVTAVLLLLADLSKKTAKNVSFRDAIIIGISQAIAMLPGISRSGATISTSVMLGNDKSKAAQFSFLMVVPLILGKVAKDILGSDISVESSTFTPLLIGFIAAFVSGLFACTIMIKLVRNSKLKYFSIYCAIVGIIAISFSLLN